MVNSSPSRPSGRDSRDFDEVGLSNAMIPFYATAARSASTDRAKNTKSGSPEQPIWVSDDDVTLDDEESNMAIRGTRRGEELPPTPSLLDSPKKSPPSASKKKAPAKSTSWTKAQAPSKQALSRQKTPPPSPKPSKGRKSDNVAELRSPAKTAKTMSTTPTRDSDIPRELKPSSSRTEACSSLSSSSASSKKSNHLHIDITALDEELEDPELEQELEEIALTGRTGLISGTPAAYDLEKGKKKKKVAPAKSDQKQKQAMKNDPPAFVEDEEDRSWHGPLPSRDDVLNKQAVKKRTLYVVILVAFLCAVGVVLFNVLSKGKKSKEPIPSGDETEATLTERQQQMHDILSSITAPHILENPASPQYAARRWLLFRDSDLGDVVEARVIQRYALASFFFSTGGADSWPENQWLRGHECGAEPWEGLNCDPRQEVRALVLDNVGLKGTIPPETGHLSKLEHLILKNNPELFGWVPTTLGHLKELQQLGLYNNNLSGVVPDIFEHANALQFINMEKNNLHGSIPYSISHLTDLHTLVLSNNELEGVVPINQLSKTRVKYLGLSHNRLSGMMERSIKDLEALEYLYLDNNQIGGRIPETIGELTHLKSIDLGNNSLMGTVPSELGELTRLDFISLNNNELVGALPMQLGLLTNLRTLNLASNQLNGELPNISNMIHLVNLHLFENSFSGPLPEAIQQLQSLEILFLSSNQFTGSIPPGIRRLSRTLRGLYLSDNQFDGSIPDELCTFGTLEALFLDTNQLVGSIPACFGDLVELKQLFLFQNQLTGSVPPSLQELRELTGLGLESNNIVGEVPDEVCGLVDNFSLDIWADCGSNPLQCSCCSVCCPSAQCT